MPYLSALEVCSRRGAIQIHVYLYLVNKRCDPCCSGRRNACSDRRGDGRTGLTLTTTVVWQKAEKLRTPEFEAWLRGKYSYLVGTAKAPYNTYAIQNWLDLFSPLEAVHQWCQFVSSIVQSISVTWFSPSPTLLTARVSGHPRTRRLLYEELALKSASVPSLFVDL